MGYRKLFLERLKKYHFGDQLGDQNQRETLKIKSVVEVQN